MHLCLLNCSSIYLHSPLSRYGRIWFKLVIYFAMVLALKILAITPAKHLTTIRTHMPAFFFINTSSLFIRAHRVQQGEPKYQIQISSTTLRNGRYSNICWYENEIIMVQALILWCYFPPYIIKIEDMLLFILLWDDENEPSVLSRAQPNRLYWMLLISHTYSVSVVVLSKCSV